MNMEATSTGDLVTYHREEHVGFITLNRPEKRNALSVSLWNALDKAVGVAGEDIEARVVIVRGSGKSFCAGLDLSPDNQVISTITGQAAASQKIAFYKEVKRIQAIHTRLERLSQPTIAAIHGHCLGAGLELALCCDIRLCSEDTVFALPEATLAIITDVGGLQRLPKVVGQGHAREIAFRGHRFSAQHAMTINLVNEVYADKETLDIKAQEMAMEIAGNPPFAVQGAKDVFLYNEEVPMDQALDYNAARSSMIMPSEDLFEAMSAFMQKRKGNFKGA
jgi:Delta3,5-Delta2,4-dienoyl-CoA isomerase